MSPPTTEDSRYKLLMKESARGALARHLVKRMLLRGMTADDIREVCDIVIEHMKRS